MTKNRNGLERVVWIGDLGLCQNKSCKKILIWSDLIKCPNCGCLAIKNGNFESHCECGIELNYNDLLKCPDCGCPTPNKVWGFTIVDGTFMKTQWVSDRKKLDVRKPTQDFTLTISPSEQLRVTLQEQG